MIRRSEWRRLAKDPRSPFAWWWRDVRLATFGIALFVLATCVIAVLALSGGFALPFLFLVPSLALIVGTTALVRYRRADPALAGLTPLPAPSEAFPVEFSLFEGDVCTGRDEGMASFLEGWMHVEGLRTSFSLRPIDTVRIGFSPRGFDQFDLPDGQRIEVRPLAASLAERATFQETVRVWHRFGESPMGEPLLPPLRVHATAVTRPLTRIAISLLSLPVLIALILWITIALGGSMAGAILFPIMPGAYGLYCLLGGLAGGVRDLRRLEAIDHVGLGPGDGPVALEVSTPDLGECLPPLKPSNLEVG